VETRATAAAPETAAEEATAIQVRETADVEMAAARAVAGAAVAAMETAAMVAVVAMETAEAETEPGSMTGELC
jgi:hypothetical protein